MWHRNVNFIIHIVKCGFLIHIEVKKLIFSVFRRHLPSKIKMPIYKKFARKCEICCRDTYEARMLGPLMHTKTISAHYNCVLFSPVAPTAVNLAPHQEADGIAGVTARFIREEGGRSKQLVIFFCFNFFSDPIDAIFLYFSDLQLL